MAKGYSDFQDNGLNIIYACYFWPIRNFIPTIKTETRLIFKESNVMANSKGADIN